MTDRGGKTTTYVYDAINRITEIHRPNGVSTYNTYNARDQIVTLKNTCDECGWVISQYDYTYDANGNLISETGKYGTDQVEAYYDYNRKFTILEASNKRIIWFRIVGEVRMSIYAVKHVNKDENDRIEYLFVDWDYIDGSDYIAKLFSEEYGFAVGEKFDGIWYSIIRIHLGKCEYELLWHEDTGNAIYCLNQTKEENDILQHRLQRILDILNARIEKQPDNDE